MDGWSGARAVSVQCAHNQEIWVIDFSGSSDGESGRVFISACRRSLQLEHIASVSLPAYTSFLFNGHLMNADTLDVQEGFLNGNDF